MDARLIELLATANGTRRTRTLVEADVLATIREARKSPWGYAFKHGGTAQNGRTTLCFAVADEGGVVVGIAPAMPDRPNPGWIWKELQPWRQDPARNIDAAVAWAARTAKDRVRVPHVASLERRITADDLLAQVIANPDDDDARLVYADFLGDDPRAELIAVQCQLARRPNAKLRERERQLLRKHRSQFVKDTLQVARECELDRGFVRTIVADASAFARNAWLLDREPIEELVLCDRPNGADLELLARTPHVARLRALRITRRVYRDRSGFGKRIGVTGLAIGTNRVLQRLIEFVRSPYVGKLRELELQIAFGANVDAQQIPWPKIDQLRLDLTGP